MRTGKTFTFHSPYDQYAERIGQRATVLGMVPHKDFDYAECGPMYRIRFEDGGEIEAWPEEVETIPGVPLRGAPLA
jgi:hypothetical protein